MSAPALNETHDPSRRSWVASANAPDTDFPIQNLPYGVFRIHGDRGPRVGVAIGDCIVDLPLARARGAFGHEAAAAAAACCDAPSLNELMALGCLHWASLRRRLSDLLAAGHPAEAAHREMLEPALVPMASAEMSCPASVGDYTDFYASVHHATNVGRMLRPDTPLMPNYKHVPIGYHGRASSIVVSGTGVHRPWGQSRPDGAGVPVFGPSRRLDYELELGLFVGPGNRLGEPIAVDEAPRHLFGVCLLNDWSARDIQGWEYQPLGPFLGKSFATSISPWVITMEALAPFRCAGAEREEGDPRPLPYLLRDEDRAQGGIDVGLSVSLVTPRMRAEGAGLAVLSRSSTRTLYWTPAQMLAHHTSNGCNLRPGDLIATGTVSGPDRSARGCLLELSWRGTDPLRLPNGEERSFLEDGDEVVFHGRCSRDGFVPIGLGECRGTVLPAVTFGRR